MKQIATIISAMLIGLSPVWAYDFSAVAPSGQILYYNIVNGNAQVTYQRQYWSGGRTVYSNPDAIGNLVIPDSIYHGGVWYSVTSIGGDAFNSCSGLTSITIPNSITSIESYAFAYCTGLDSITIPNSVTSIEFGAFAYCTGLDSITIPNSVTSIWGETFYSCSGLNSVIIPNTVTYIGERAFFACQGLTYLTIGNSVTSIDNHAFYGCSSLSSITMKCYPPAIQSTTFTGLPVNIPIYVPCGAMSSYMSAANWSNFTHFVEGCATITVTTNDFTLGGVTGGGTYNAGDTVTLTAIPFPGSYFVGWSNGSQENPLTFIATTNASYVAAFVVDSLPQDTVYIHDTTYIILENHDTVFVNHYVHDTLIDYIHDTTFINNYIHDTLFYPVYIHDTTIVNHFVYDTVYFHDTVYRDRYIHDTIYVHDTIYIQEGEGIDNITQLNAKIYQRNGMIVVEGAEGNPVYLYDVVGRLLATRRETMQEVLLDVPASGAYLVKIGDAPARRIVVRR